MGSIGVVYCQLLKALWFTNDTNGCRGTNERESLAYKSQTRNTLCRSINNPAGAPRRHRRVPMPPAHAYTLVGHVCVCVCTCACVYPLSHGGVVIRRVPPVPALPDRSDEEARSEKRRGVVRRRQKPSALYYLRIHIGRRGKEQAHSLTSFARKEERKKKQRTDRTTLLRHVYTLSPITPPGYVRSHTCTYIRVYIFTCEHSRRSAASAENARTVAEGLGECKRQKHATHDRRTHTRNPRSDVNRYYERDASKACVSSLNHLSFRVARMFSASCHSNCVSHAAS